MASKSPNQEQNIAISRVGGVLLSAGAGSGKTFVIIEHIIFKLQVIRTKHSYEYLSKNIISILSGITLMTFTKKAAGEMSIRLTRRMEELLLEENTLDKKFWELIHKNLSAIKILTIHGLCHHLLRSGYWPSFPLEIDLLNEVAHRQKIKILFDQWYEKSVTFLKPQFLAHTHELFIAIEEIFASPDLRILWEAPVSITNCEQELDAFFIEWCQFRNLDKIFVTEHSYKDDKKKNEKKGFQALASFSSLVKKVGKINSKNFASYKEFFHELGRFPTATKDMRDDELAFREELKLLHEDIKTWGDDLLEIKENFESYQEWANTLLSAFKFINVRYQDLPGFSFADLEYYVYKGLDNALALKKIQESHIYFIVDEFQDTSYVQFDILKKLIGNDFLKLYAVGDRKQAIYGFRGGELQVFHECEGLMTVKGNLSLLSNYRSKKNIINFNNQFFTTIFPLGYKFENIDAHHTHMEEQVVPDVSPQSDGEVYVLTANLSNEGSEINLDLTEAQILADEIEHLASDDKVHSICVLYRKLRPSYYLMDILKEKNLSFSAQIKIAFLDDPLISFFKILVENVLNADNDEKKRASFFQLCSLGEILGIEGLIQSHVDDFIKNAKLLGIKNSFLKLVLNLGITNSFFEQNLKLIFSICDLGLNDFIQIYHLLKENNSEYSSELVSGKNIKRITLMSAHASKGLEFDAVLLGGVHSNGGYQGMKDKIGKMPRSFRWKKSYDQNKFSKSPAYFLEAEILKQKNFSESKRLLYVACTRAVSKLCWVDLRQDEKELINDQNSWIKALRMSSAVVKPIVCNNSTIVTGAKISFLQKDSLGLSISKAPICLGVISELSVTRLATLALCPFKFYLQNICKINSTEKFFESDKEVEPVFYSSKERGTAIHLILSKLMKNQLNHENIPAPLVEIVKWVEGLAKPYESYTRVSEEIIKFSFFNNMISGTPDIYFLNNDHLVLWDFKTGKRDQNNEASYWFQLLCYAYGIGKIYPQAAETVIEIGLIYVDEKKNFTKKITMTEISRELFSIWKKTESLYQVNLDHCSQCEYSSICNKNIP